MRKLFAAILLMATSSIFAETWTQTLKGYDCRGSCWLYSDSSNVMYGKYFASHFSDVRTATIVLTDSGLSFGEFFDPFEANYPGVICFSLADGLCDCSFFVGAAPLGSSAIPAFCGYDFLVSAFAANSTVP